MAFDKLVVVTQKTWLEGLIEKFNTKAQAQFYIERNNLAFEPYEVQHAQYHTALRRFKQLLPSALRVQFVDRGFLPNFLFGDRDLVVTIGRDGLVVNTAKYLDAQPILALNPDPARVEGVLLPFTVDQFPKALARVQAGQSEVTPVTMARVELQDQQVLHGFNDLFVGHQSHQSARYTLTYRGQTERHSSSGLIVSTGAGSTGWFKSVVTGAVAVTNAFRGVDLFLPQPDEYRFPWDADHLVFSVREPWVSRTSQGGVVFGKLERGETLVIESNMPEGGVIFSDGIESDFLRFTSGTVATIGVADKRAHLVTGVGDGVGA